MKHTSSVMKTTVPDVKPDKRIMGGHEVVRVACIQAPQIVFNKEKSIDIACRKIKEAAAAGAKLVAFSESYIPCYAAYYNSAFDNSMEEWTQWNMGLQKNSIVIPSADTDRIGEACREAGVYCVMGVNELDDAEGVRTYYNTQIIFGADGSVLGRHRKIKPTYNERCYWGEGDGSDLNVYRTPIGRIGSLVCWEHHTIAISRAQMMMGEEFHIANWPGFWQVGPDKPLQANNDPDGNGCDGITACKEYAFQAGCFVISVHGLLREQDFEPEYKNLIGSKDMSFDWAKGGSCVIGPLGNFITKPVLDEDTIVYADCHADEIRASKAFFDGMGHYSRPDVAHIELNPAHNVNLTIAGRPSAGQYAPEYAYLREISEKYEVALEKLEALANRIETSDHS
ncbi:MAG: carbon-nitrogen hydrolase family protein [Eubacterium sp.]